MLYLSQIYFTINNFMISSTYFQSTCSKYQVINITWYFREEVHQIIPRISQASFDLVKIVKAQMKKDEQIEMKSCEDVISNRGAFYYVFFACSYWYISVYYISNLQFYSYMSNLFIYQSVLSF